MGKYVIRGNKKYLKDDETLRNEKRARQYLKKNFNLNFNADEPSVKALVVLLNNRYLIGFKNGQLHERRTNAKVDNRRKK